MSGSGNDFVFFDARAEPSLADRLRDASFVRAVCAQHTGVGADGVCAIQVSVAQDFRLLYLNRDGSLGELCGNASLCATRLAVELGISRADEVGFETDSGVVRGRIRDGEPEIDLQPSTGLRADAGIPTTGAERRLGFVNTGVPHLVVRTDSVSGVPLEVRGPILRHHPSLPAGANVNWVAPAGAGRWRMRTFERGVEGETLACGTGAVACAELLAAWGEAAAETRIETSSGRTLTVRRSEVADRVIPSLAGEGRIVFDGLLREL